MSNRCSNVRTFLDTRRKTRAAPRKIRCTHSYQQHLPALASCTQTALLYITIPRNTTMLGLFFFLALYRTDALPLNSPLLPGYDYIGELFIIRGHTRRTLTCNSRRRRSRRSYSRQPPIGRSYRQCPTIRSRSRRRWGAGGCNTRTDWSQHRRHIRLEPFHSTSNVSRRPTAKPAARSGSWRRHDPEWHALEPWWARRLRRLGGAWE